MLYLASVDISHTCLLLAFFILDRVFYFYCYLLLGFLKNSCCVSRAGLHFLVVRRVHPTPAFYGLLGVTGETLLPPKSRVEPGKHHLCPRLPSMKPHEETVEEQRTPSLKAFFPQRKKNKITILPVALQSQKLQFT